MFSTLLSFTLSTSALLSGECPAMELTTTTLSAPAPITIESTFQCETNKSSHTVTAPTDDTPTQVLLELLQLNQEKLCETGLSHTANFALITNDTPETEALAMLTHKNKEHCEPHYYTDELAQLIVANKEDVALMKECQAFNEHEKTKSVDMNGYIETPIEAECGTGYAYTAIDTQSFLSKITTTRLALPKTLNYFGTINLINDTNNFTQRACITMKKSPEAYAQLTKFGVKYFGIVGRSYGIVNSYAFTDIEKCSNNKSYFGREFIPKNQPKPKKRSTHLSTH